MAIYFETLQQFRSNGGLKATTITARQLLPAVVAHMQRMDRSFSLHINGRLPKPMDELLDEVFALCHLQQPFYTQHCASRNMRYKSVSKSRVKIDFTLRYRMTRDEEKWVLAEIRRMLARITTETMSAVEKVVAVHDYIIRAYDYEMETDGSPFTVYTFMQERRGVCMAYALLFEKMMEELSIPCYYVVGKADGEHALGHAWNMVELDGQWYHIDVTWDDLGKGGRREIRYRYFLRSDEVFRRDHQWNFDHYPPCVSDRFDKMSALYDAAYYDGRLYFPHPKTAQLTMLNLETLVFKRMLPVRVQLCAVHKGTLYVCNADDGGFLYAYAIETKEMTRVRPEQVQRIQSDTSRVVITFISGEVLEIADTQEEGVATCIEEPDVTVPLLRFGDSWFGTYEGKEARVAFEADDGVRLVLQERVKQLTVDLLLHRTLDLTLQSARKDVRVSAAVLSVPKTLLPEQTVLLIPFKEEEKSFIVNVNGSIQIPYK